MRSGSTARYRVREQLTFFSLPNDAVGATPDVSGGIVLSAAGRIVPAQSKIVVGLRSLKSDQDRRDSYVQGNVLETQRYPTAVFTIHRASGLPRSLPPRARSPSPWRGISRCTA